MVERRPPELVMRLDRLGAAHQTRLSFLRALLRRVQRERWSVDRPLWRLDGDGHGVGVYRARTPGGSYSLVCFSQPLAPERRTDRVLAEAWDTAYALVDGEPGSADIERLGANVPRQEAGRYLASELVLARANKSVRLFEHVVASLTAGRQPEAGEIERVGYLMRTTAVYGNGKFGIADRDVIAGRPELSGPYRAEMLAVWLIRSFTVDLAEHIAACRAPATAASLAPRLRRRLGIGNSTGLGMAPFLVKHLKLFGRWVEQREAAPAAVRSLPDADATAKTAFLRVLERARRGLAGWTTADAVQAPRIAALRDDLARLAAHAVGALEASSPWDRLYRWAEANLSLEGQEYTVTLLLEPQGALVDELAETMAADEEAAFAIDGAMGCAALRAPLDRHYGWALATDYGAPQSQARFWYTSVAKLEPRLGERWEEAGGEREQPLGVGRDVAALRAALAAAAPGERLAEFLRRQPEHRHVVRRVQATAAQPYAEIRDNLLGAAMRPIDMLRAKLAFFGTTRFDPLSDRLLRITLYQGTPYPQEMADAADDWIYDTPLADP